MDKNAGKIPLFCQGLYEIFESLDDSKSKQLSLEALIMNQSNQIVL